MVANLPCIGHLLVSHIRTGRRCERKEEELYDRTMTIKFDDENAMRAKRVRSLKAVGGKNDAVTRIPSSQYAQFCCRADPAETEITLAENEGLDVALDVGVSGGTGYPGTPYE